ncbi:hypothetical protein GCM10010245_79030 [Streptomyces spectabilis]|nr:hypothetical protein GCM10010245_79030 [Streptomyces spectabilis]
MGVDDRAVAPGQHTLLRGGSYHSLAPYAACAHANDAPPGLHSPGIGIRPVRDTPPIRLATRAVNGAAT